MKKIPGISALATILISVIVIGGCANREAEDRGYIVNVGQEAPDFTAILANGDTFRLSENRGKIVMLQFQFAGSQ